VCNTKKIEFFKAAQNNPWNASSHAGNHILVDLILCSSMSDQSVEYADSASESVRIEKL
jgi:hypothetical protein